MRSIVSFYTATMVLVTAMVAVAVMWTHLSHLKRYDGPMLWSISATHGVHLFDLAVLGLEVLLFLLLSIVLLTGFSDRR